MCKDINIEFLRLVLLFFTSTILKIYITPETILNYVFGAKLSIRLFLGNEFVFTFACTIGLTNKRSTFVIWS